MYAKGSGQPLAVVADPPSLSEVFRRHSGFVWRMVRRFGATEEHADDLVQDVFVVLQRRLPEYDGRAALPTWLYQIARGVVSNHHRTVDRSARRLRLVWAGSVASSTDPDVGLEAARAAAAVRTFVARLDVDKRAVFELCDVEGVPAPEVARMLEINLNTVYSRLRAARQQFRDFAEGYRAGREPLRSGRP